MLREPSHRFEKVIILVAIVFIVLVTMAVAFVVANQLALGLDGQPTTTGSPTPTVTPTPTSARQKVPLKGEYTWQDTSFEPLASQKIWEPIASPRFTGLGLPGVSEVYVGCGAGDPQALEKLTDDTIPHLRVEGGLCRKWVWIQYQSGDQTIEIRSEPELIAAIEPIDSAARASSFLGALLSDLATTNNDIYLSGTTTPIAGGYLVQLSKNNTFGCGNHAPQKVIYQVTQAGSFSLVAEEIVDQNAASASPGLCVD